MVFRSVIEELACEVLLAVPHANGNYVVMTDASDVGVGAVLMQEQGDEVVVLEFASRKLTLPERKWTIRDREAVAIKFGCSKFHHFIVGRKTLIITDCQSLTFMKDADCGRVHRLWLYLQRYDLRIVHWNGKFNILADWLSRAVDMTAEEDQEVDEMSMVMCTVSHEMNFVQDCRLPTATEILDAYKMCSVDELRDTYETSDGLRYSVRFDRLFIPQRFRAAVTYWFHCGKFGGHYGVGGTWRRMRKLMWWPNMKEFVADYVSKCLPCCRYRPLQGRTLRGMLEKPWLFQMVSLDCVGLMDWQGKTNFWIIVIIDHASRYVVTKLWSVKPTAKSIASVFSDMWLAYFGTPDVILCDRGSEFVGREFREWVVKQLDMRVVFTSAGYPQGNGMNERCHQPLMHSVVTRASLEPGVHLSELLRDATLAYNAVPKKATGNSPFFVVTGCEMRLPGLSLFVGQPSEEQRQCTVREMRYQAMARMQLKKEDFTAKPKQQFSKGDVVLRMLTEYERQQHPGVAGSASMRFAPKWSSPAKVVEIKGEAALVCGLRKKLLIVCKCHNDI